MVSVRFSPLSFELLCDCFEALGFFAAFACLASSDHGPQREPRVVRSPGGVGALLPLGLGQFPIRVDLVFELAPQGFPRWGGVRATARVHLERC